MSKRRTGLLALATLAAGVAAGAAAEELVYRRTFRRDDPEAQEQLGTVRGERFEVTPLDGWSLDDVHDLWRRVAVGARGPATFGLLDLAEHKRYLLRGRSLAAIDEAMPRQLSAASRGLDARILTETILRPLLGIDDAALAGGQRVAFSADVDAIWRDAERDGHRFAFLLNPTRVDQVSAVADLGELMPQKTTYFYPKLATGMTFNLLDD